MPPTQKGREMDSIEQEKRQAMAEFRRAASSRRALHALLSICLLSFFLLVSLSSWDLHLHHLPLFLIDPQTDCFWVDRKAMFLLCNIILVVIAMDSGLLASCMPEWEPCDDLLSVREKGHRSMQEGSPEVGSAAIAGSTLQVLAMDKGSEPEEEEGEEEHEQEEEEVEEDWCPDMDELNKKFEDFIEKVKRDRQMEALQLVLV